MSSDTDIENRLRSIEQKIEENSKILRSIRRKQLFTFWFGVIKILVVVGVFYYAYIFVEPFLNQLKEAYISIQEFSNTADSFKGINVFDLIR